MPPFYHTLLCHSGNVKWQSRWETSDRGRNLYTFRPNVGHTIKHSFASTVGESIISQLRTGYVGLNEYLHKCNFKDSDLCKCGAKETVSHYLLECNEFDTARELMRKKLFETCGIIHLDMNLLLDVKQDDIYRLEKRHTIRTGELCGRNQAFCHTNLK